MVFMLSHIQQVSQKQVAQKSNGESRKFYNVSSNERYVDYKN